MKIEGSVRANLLAAIASAKRLRDRPVHSDTLLYWSRLIDHARRGVPDGDGVPVGELVSELEAQLAVRKPLPR